jgi:hypothetical protein
MSKPFLVPNPWTDSFCIKNGLVRMYIESSIAEILYLRAESEPGVKLNCPNPVYTRYHELLGNCLESDGSSGSFEVLKQFIEDNVCHRPITISPTTTDIRLVDTIEEALGWLAGYLKI